MNVGPRWCKATIYVLMNNTPKGSELLPAPHPLYAATKILKLPSFQILQS